VRNRIESLLEKIFPGMGWRPLWMVALATGALIVYQLHGLPEAAPDWFLDVGRRITGIQDVGFHLHGWAHLSAVVVLLIMPLAICSIGTDMGPRALGFRVRGAGRQFRLVLFLWLAFIPVVWLVSRTEAFSQAYPRLPGAGTDPDLFFAYEAFYLVKWTSWEFFFRGFMLFGFLREFGTRAVLISTIPFTLVHLGKPEPEVFSAFLGGLILCSIALRAKSIWPGVFLHAMVATTMDFFAAGWWR
jgi:membrane protease YdiL (CAAX protease family)